MLKAKLVVVGGDAKRTDVPLRKLPATIGRAREATITLPHSLVSRQHCEIFEQNGQLFVKDLKSLNGTYVNNEKISEPTSILSGQLLTLGNVTFRAVYEVSMGGDSEQDDQSTGELQQDETIDIRFHTKQNAAPDSSNPPAVEADTDHGRPDTPKFKSAGADDSPIGAGADHDLETVHLVLDDEAEATDQSISLGAIAELPAQGPQASFAGGVTVDADDKSADVDPDSVRIKVDDSPEQSASESSLDDFFRKMPK